MMSSDERYWTRLIDGELSFSDQRELLGTLDEIPGGWKRLALALLEADAFRRELRSISPPEPVAIATPVKSANRPNGYVKQIAAACVIGLGLGVGIEHSHRPIAAFVGETIPVAIQRTSSEVRTQETLKLVFADAQLGVQSVDLPVIDAGEVAVAELVHQSAVSDEMRKNLEAQGGVIHEERSYVPVSLTDGRQGIAPISDVVVEFQPIAFQ
jgi:hypothetical protein